MLVGETATVTAFIGVVTGSIEVTCTSEAGESVGNITVYANPESNVPTGHFQQALQLPLTVLLV
jgi:hypothetical protein